VIVVGALAIDFALRSVLLDQAKLQLTETADQIEQTAREESSYGFADEEPLTLYLSDRVALDRWASSNQYIQIDTPAGQTLGKSSDLGGITLPPFAPSNAGGFIALRLAGNRPGTMLVLDRVITNADGRPIVLAQIGERLDSVDELIARARIILFFVALAAAIAVGIVA